MKIIRNYYAYLDFRNMYLADINKNLAMSIRKHRTSNKLCKIVCRTRATRADS